MSKIKLSSSENKNLLLTSHSQTDHIKKDQVKSNRVMLKGMYVFNRQNSIKNQMNQDYSSMLPPNTDRSGSPLDNSTTSHPKLKSLYHDHLQPENIDKYSAKNLYNATNFSADRINKAPSLINKPKLFEYRGGKVILNRSIYKINTSKNCSQNLKNFTSSINVKFFSKEYSQPSFQNKSQFTAGNDSFQKNSGKTTMNDSKLNGSNIDNTCNQKSSLNEAKNIPEIKCINMSKLLGPKSKNFSLRKLAGDREFKLKKIQTIDIKQADDMYKSQSQYPKSYSNIQRNSNRTFFNNPT